METVRGNVTIDWTLRENVRANLRRQQPFPSGFRGTGIPPGSEVNSSRPMLDIKQICKEPEASCSTYHLHCGPIHLMEDIDGIIERHGGWPDAFLLTNINGCTPTS